MKKVREGYKMTELGEIPVEWEVKSLSDVSEINPKKDIIEDNKEVSFIAMEDVSNEGRIIKKNIRKYGDVKKGYTAFKNSDVLLAKITPCFENGKKAIATQLINEIGFGSTEFHVLRAKEDYTIPSYIYYTLSTNRFMQQAQANMTGSAGQKRVPTEFLKEYRIATPSVIEQQKISLILSSVDEQVEITDNLIEKTKELKKGLMQRLLTKGIGHDSFKDTEIGRIPEEWKVDKLERYVEIRSGNSPSSFALMEEGDYPFYKVDDMNYTEKYLNKSKVWFNETSFQLMPKGMVVFPKRGASIFTNKVAILDRDGFFDTNVMGLICKDGLLNEYLFYQLKFIELKKFADTTAVPQINNKHINPLIIPIPKLEEQVEIVLILSSVDEKIDQYVSKKVKLQELKKGLMQKLLTGKIRVNV